MPEIIRAASWGWWGGGGGRWRRAGEGCAWLGGEAGAGREGRRGLVEEKGMATEARRVCAYWGQGGGDDRGHLGWAGPARWKTLAKCV
ncbi:SIP domain-containing protein [Massilia sp. LC238]|uniref:SIP domain-containing protein n=1 Tax=Massilia sp. LC238 TaxID=1502852 RepID=UPI0005647960